MPIISPTAISPHRIGGAKNWSSYCPKQLVQTPGTIIDQMNDASKWTPSRCSVANNNTEQYNGVGTIKVTTTNSGCYISQPMTADERFEKTRIAVYLHTSVDTLASIRIYFYSSGFTKYFNAQYYTTEAVGGNGWYFTGATGRWITLGGLPMSNVGGCTWDEVVGMRITINNLDNCEVSFACFEVGISLKQTIMMSFDDAFGSIYTVAYPLLKERNMVATAYIYPAVIGGGARLSIDNLMELNNNGWDIGNHSSTHANFHTLTEGEMVDEFTGCETYLNGLGLTRASKHVAYVGGYIDTTIMSAMVTAGMLTGRTAQVNTNIFTSALFPLKIHAGGSVDKVFIKASIDKYILAGSTKGLTFHNIGGGGDISEADFEEILDYIVSLGLQTLTISEYYRLNSEAITVYHK